MEDTDARPLEVGDVIQESFRVVGENFGVFVLMGAMVQVPGTVLGVVTNVLLRDVVSPEALQSGDEDRMLAGLGATFGVLGATLLLSMVLGAIGQGGALYATVEHLVGRKASFGDAMRVGLGRFFWVFLCSLLVGMVVGFGMLFCLVPGMVAAIWLCAAMPAVVAEDLGPVAAMQRSVDLTEGHRMTIFLVYLVFGLAAVGVSMCIMFPASMMSAAGTQPGEMPDPLAPAQLVATGLQLVVSIGTFMVATALNGVIYARLRGLRDGVDASALAQVFS